MGEEEKNVHRLSSHTLSFTCFWCVYKFLFVSHDHIYSYLYLFLKPLPWPVKTHTCCHGCGFGWVGVWVAWEYPRVTRGNPYWIVWIPPKILINEMLNAPANANFSTWPHFTTQHHCQNPTDWCRTLINIFSLYIYIFFYTNNVWHHWLVMIHHHPLIQVTGPHQ